MFRLFSIKQYKMVVIVAYIMVAMITTVAVVKVTHILVEAAVHSIDVSCVPGSVSQHMQQLYHREWSQVSGVQPPVR